MFENNRDQTDLQGLPDWWQREKRIRQKRTLLFLIVVLALIGYFYYASSWGRIGKVGVIDWNTAGYIAFTRLEERDRPDGKGKETLSSIYAIRSDGTDLRPLTPPDDKSDKFTPAWTMDGKSILYSSNRNDSQVRQIFILGSGEPRQLTYGTGNKEAPVASPDRKRIAFVTQGAIKSVYLNGEDVYQEIPRPRAGHSGENEGETPGGIEPRGPFVAAAYSADGKSIAGVQVLNSESLTITSDAAFVFGDQLARVSLASGGSFFLDTGREVSIAWDPKGLRLACAYTELEAKDKDGKPQLRHGINLWTFEDPSRPRPQPLIGSMGFGLLPKHIAWSPDGARIAFEAWHLKSEGERVLLGIAVINVTGQPAGVPPEMAAQFPCMIPVTAEGRPQNPRWSPDGSRLLYELARPDGGSDLCIVNTDGTNPINLTKGQGDNIQPAWSPATPK